MSHARARLVTWSFLAGLAWGGLAWILGRRAYGPSITYGVAAAPLIGVVLGVTMQRWFEAAHGGWRWAVSLATLYAGGTLFGLAIALGEFARRGPSASLAGVCTESVLATWWGLTATGFLLVLLPLTWATHWLLEFDAERSG